MNDEKTNLVRLGWREWMELPEISGEPIKAKIDTGARSSALHAESIERFDRDGAPWVRFTFLPRQRSEKGRAIGELPVHDVRDVKSSSGDVQTRIVVRTPIQFGEHSWEVDLTLSDREQMGFRMLVGREAIRGRCLVDPGSSFRFGKPGDMEASPDGMNDSDESDDTDDADESHAAYDADADDSQ